MLLESTKMHFIKYDVVNVFTIGIYKDANKQRITAKKEPIANHSIATLEEIA